jgi:hypothetical protein
LATGIYIYIGNHSNQYELRLRVESQSGISKTETLSELVIKPGEGPQVYLEALAATDASPPAAGGKKDDKSAGILGTFRLVVHATLIGTANKRDEAFQQFDFGTLLRVAPAHRDEQDRWAGTHFEPVKEIASLPLVVNGRVTLSWDGKNERVKLDIKQSRGIELQKPTDNKAKAVS